MSTLYIVYILLHILTFMKGIMTIINSLFIYKPLEMKIWFYQTHTLVPTLFANLVKVECHPKCIISLCQFPYCSNQTHLSLVEDDLHPPKQTRRLLLWCVSSCYDSMLTKFSMHSQSIKWHNEYIQLVVYLYGEHTRVLMCVFLYLLHSYHRGHNCPHENLKPLSLKWAFMQQVPKWANAHL